MNYEKIESDKILIYGGLIMKVTLAPMTEEYGKEVMAVFNYYIENSYAAYFEQCLPDAFFGRLLEMINGYPAYVVKDTLPVQTIGFGFLRPYHPLPAFRETAEISYFIAKKAVGKGLGKVLLDRLIREAKPMGIRRIMASVSSLNEPSLRFHRKNGFKECGRFCAIGKKKGSTFDVIWFQKNLEEESS
jgi:L-amino acid N-acyltransferase YncA